MEFDRLQKQYVEKRRNISPVRNIKQSRHTFDDIIYQKVGKREKRRKPVEIKYNSEPKDSRFTLKAFIPWLKKTMIIGALLFLCFIGINWNGFAWSNTEQEIYIPPLDPVSPLVKFASVNPLNFFTDGNETVESVLTEEIPPALPEVIKTFSYSIHEVKRNESATGIAQKHSIKIGTLVSFNNLKDASKLSIGQQIKIPNMDGIPYTIRQGDTIYGIAEKNKINANEILDVNNIIDDKLIKSGDIIFLPGAKMNADDLSMAIGLKPARTMIRPVPGNITSRYGMREDPFNPGSRRMRFHRGIDYSGNLGDPVKAALHGTAERRTNSVLGNHIVINHDGGYSTIYAHLSAFSVRSGERVRQGQEIGKIGRSGLTTGSHLHFEVRLNGVSVNPQDLIKN